MPQVVQHTLQEINENGDVIYVSEHLSEHFTENVPEPRNEDANEIINVDDDDEDDDINRYANGTDKEIPNKTVDQSVVNAEPNDSDCINGANNPDESSSSADEYQSPPPKRIKISDPNDAER